MILLLGSHLSCLHHLAYVWIALLVLYNIHYNQSLLSFHSWTDSWLFLFTLQYYSNNTILKQHGLNFWLHSENSPFAVLPVFSSFVKVLMSHMPSLPSQLFITGTFSSSVKSYVFLSRMFMTSSSMLSNSINLSWAFQLNKGLSRACLPCFCLCGSVRVAVVAGQDVSSVSRSAIITAVTACMAAWLTFVWMPPRFCQFSLI